MDINLIRNFAIIAHVDHGKSTLADRLLEVTGTVAVGKHEAQLLDRNPISRERGITIKLAPVTMNFKYDNEFKIENLKFKIPDSTFILNLVDTPGHVDFTYEVERTLACVEGAVLLVDATQGIQAQTIAHTQKALELGLTIIPAVNKIDLPQAQIEATVEQLANYLGVSKESVLLISAKTGAGINDVLTAIIDKVPLPNVNQDYSEAVIFDSYYDEFRGVIAFVRVKKGKFKQGTVLKINSNQTEVIIQEVGLFKPELTKTDILSDGQIGYLVTNLKDIHLVRVGDSLVEKNTLVKTGASFKKVKPMIFASIFTTDPNFYPNLKKAIEKLYLNDAALVFEAIYSNTFGSGFKVGFLGLLHADITRERLEREFNLDLILTPPQVDYLISENVVKEPYCLVTIIAPNVYLGSIMQLANSSRAQFVSMDNLNLNKNLSVKLNSQIILKYQMPLSELVSNFFDKLKSVSSGYASLDWEFSGHREVKADKLKLLINNEVVEEFSEIVVSDLAFEKGRELTSRLRELIPRQQFEVKIQAQYKGKIIASERLCPLRKDVTAKLYGGDRSRKDKLLSKQKKGKKLLKNIGRVEVPKEVFIELFKMR